MLKKANLIFYYFFRYPVYKLLLKKLGPSSRLVKCKIDGPSRISIGTKVFINAYGWLACEPLTGNKDCSLSIGDGTYIGRFSHIYATSSIRIGNKVLLADKVYLSDNLHGHKNISIPVIDQPVEQINPVVIEDGAWIGENACIIGASVGKNAVIGANAVVTKDVPDFCVAVGAPAYIIKRYDFELKDWRKTDKEGRFI